MTPLLYQAIIAALIVTIAAYIVSKDKKGI